MRSTSYIAEQQQTMLLKRVLLLMMFGYCALAKLPVEWQSYRPDLFVIYLLYRAMFGGESAFSMEKSWLLGMIANICYPVYFGGVAAMFVVLYGAIEAYRPRWVMYSVFQYMILGALLLVVYNIGFLLLYKDLNGGWLTCTYWHAVGVNIALWCVVVSWPRSEMLHGKKKITWRNKKTDYRLVALRKLVIIRYCVKENIDRLRAR